MCFISLVVNRCCRNMQNFYKNKNIILQWHMYVSFDDHVTVRCVKFLTIKPTRYTISLNLFLEWNSACFGQFLCPSSGVFHCTHFNVICHTGLLTAVRSCQQNCMTYTMAVCTLKNSWWWTEKLFETCRVSFQE